ncbi:DgyrCDS8679 [Dimorphilus gyrociliatus]|nr:DgyrCDS8679 [Dimorphilus gyrociliatus]
MIDIKGVNTTNGSSLKGFHVHQYGKLSEECSAAGGHFNPFNKNHGSPNDTNRHVGDLGNVIVETDGTIHQTISDQIAKLTGENNIMGKSIVLHQDKDDLTSQPTGAAGKRLACCLIVESDIGNAYRIKPSVFLSLLLTISMYIFLYK